MAARGSLFLFLLGLCLVYGDVWTVRENTENDPIANSSAIVKFGPARFTILTSRLIRMEYAPNMNFVDEASLVFINRNVPVPTFTSKINGNQLTISTGDLTLSYNSGIAGGAFTPKSLNIIYYLDGLQTWVPGTPNSGNLKGTVYSLDCYQTSCQNGTALDQGLLSLDGWTLMDDSLTPLFNFSTSDGIPWIVMPNQRNGGNCEHCLDWYFFGYGLDYTHALFDYTLLSGPIAIPPTSAFGTWWSRYWPYNETTFIHQIIEGYQEHDLPLNHVVLDMDWHIEPSAKQCDSWGGYTWNTDLFPNPQAFIDYLHSPENDFRLLLNLHPNTGVDPCQAKYLELAKAIGFDTSTNATIECDFMSHLLAINQFEIVIDPVGADFWWTDYSGCHNNEQINTTAWDMLWSNHVFYWEKASKGERPLTLSRFGGPGNHRYPVGFSGDTYSVWPTLEFEIYFTQTAANILFGYWSHDTGGFHNEPSDELFLRWLQFAAVEPIYRIHSDHQERRIWEFPSYELMKGTMLLRNALGPYIYTQARRAYDTAIALVHPLYYYFPLAPEAYSYKYQYKFGADILAAPVVTPVNPATNTTVKPIWLPPGGWVNFWTLELLEGPQTLNLTVGLIDLPLYVVAGAILPLKTNASVTNYNPDPLLFAIYPGAPEGSTFYYEDDGSSTQYLSGAFAFTSVTYTISENTTKVNIGTPSGTFSGQPTLRNYAVILKGVQSSQSTTVTANGQDLPYAPDQTVPGWWQDDFQTGLVVAPNAVDTNTELSIVVQL